MSDYGHPLDPDHSAIRLAYERGYLVSDGDGWRITPAGVRIIDALVEQVKLAYVERDPIATQVLLATAAHMEALTRPLS